MIFIQLQAAVIDLSKVTYMRLREAGSRASAAMIVHFGTGSVLHLDEADANLLMDEIATLHHDKQLIARRAKA